MRDDTRQVSINLWGLLGGGVEECVSTRQRLRIWAWNGQAQRWMV